MVNAKGKAIVSSSKPMETKCQETVVACESKGAGETARKEVMNEENAILEMKNGKTAMDEEKNEEASSGGEENNEGSKMEEDKKNESNAEDVEEDNENNATAEEDDDDDDEAGKQDDEQQEEIGEEKEEHTVEQEEEKVRANSNDRVKKSRKRNRKKNVEEEEEGEEEEKGEENEEKTNEQENNKVGANSGEKVKRPRKRTRRNKMAGKGSETLAANKAEDKPGSSANKKASERTESMGMIFMCNSKTKEDCYHYKVLGLPASKKDLVQKIYRGMRLFLFDFDLKLMYGIYKAAGPGGYNIEPEAFKSAFPSQVRFTVLEDCLPLAAEEFKPVIKENYYGKNKFDCQLNSTQVKDLCKLFAASSRDSKSKKLGRNGRAGTHIGRPEPHIVKAEARTRVDQGRIRQRGRDKERRSALVVDHRHRAARPTMYDREMYRRPNRAEERRSPLVGAHRHPDHPIMYERELAPLHHLPPLPQPTAVPPYAGAPSYASYGRSLEIDAYSRDLVERRDPRLLDLDARRDEIGSRDPYASYREVPSYRDTLYSSAVLAQPEYYAPVEPRAEYRLAAPPPTEYRHPGAALSEYDRLRPLYRY